MPNIELHSFQNEALGRAKTEVKAIASYLGDELVITVCADECLNLQGQLQPFIRINDTIEDRAEELARRFKHIADVEVVILNSFYAKGK